MKREKIFEKLVLSVDLSEEPIPGLPLIEILGNRRVLIENHLGICGYTECELRIKTKLGEICVFGNHLELSKMTKEQLIIGGEIESVKLCRRH